MQEQGVIVPLDYVGVPGGLTRRVIPLRESQGRVAEEYSRPTEQNQSEEDVPQKHRVGWKRKHSASSKRMAQHYGGYIKAEATRSSKRSISLSVAYTEFKGGPLTSTMASRPGRMQDARGKRGHAPGDDHSDHGV